MAKKLWAIVLSAIMAATVFVGCGRRDSINPEIDTTKTQLYLGVYNGGLGIQWVRQVANEFEELYKDYEGVNGKKGVQVMINPQKTLFEAETLIANLKAGSETSDVYFTANTMYYKFVQEGVTEDVTDLLKEKVYDGSGEFGGTEKSILDKMDPYFVEGYKWEDGRYYGFPFEDSLAGIVYDKDLFDSKHIELPQTMAEFEDLLDRLVDMKCTPFTWTGQNPFYYTPLTTAIVAQYEGIDEANKNLTYEGEYDGQPLTVRNAYRLANQQGKKEAIKFMRLITKNPDYFSSAAPGGSQSQTMAQNEFLLSVENSKRNKQIKRIAMIIEGDWWENEARPEFTEMEGINSDYGYGKRNFAFLPIPAMEGQADSSKRMVVSFSNGSVAFINKKAAQKDLAKKWVQFMHSNSSLATFTVNTGSCLPYTYTITEEQKNSLTPFGRSVWDTRHDPNVEIVRTSNRNRFATFYEDMRMGGMGAEICSLIGGTEVKNCLSHFALNPNTTVDDYFNGSKAYYSAERWTAICDRNKVPQDTAA